MKNKFSLFSLVAIVSLIIQIPANASVEVEHLEKARAAVTSNHYHRGYVQFKKMANRGCPFSQCILGIMHQKGMGVKKNAQSAVYWFQKSAEQGFADAENRLGQMYYHGDGIPQDMKMAKKWLARAAQHGVDEARELLAQIPGESTAANDLNSLPQNAAWSVNNIRQAWQGYADVTKQLELVSSNSQPN